MIARLLFAASALAIATPAIAAKQLVVRSSGPSAKAYPVGKQLAEGMEVSLRAGDTLTVLGPAKARVLKGPGSFKMAAVADSSPYSRRSRFSARRGPPAPRGPWALDVEQSGPVCVAAAQPLSLWRSAADEDSAVTITGPAGAAVTLQWPAGEQTIAWPNALPLDPALRYRIQLKGRPAASEWKIANAGTLPADRAATAEALLSNGCSHQLEELVERALWDG